MSALNRRLIIALTAVFYCLQVVPIVYLHLRFPIGSTLTAALIDAGLALIIGLIDLIAVRYLFGAMRRIEEGYATSVSSRLERSLEEYRTVAQAEEELSREVGQAVETELAQAREALARGRVEDLDDHLQQGLDAASQAHAMPCDHVAVAAVLDAKARQCAEAGVPFDAHVTLPAELGLPDVEVASLFFNLIDNALHECVALRETSTQEAGPEVGGSAKGADERGVTVRAKVQAGQLFVEVTNPCRTGTQLGRAVKMRRSSTENLHGLGVEIVRAIARDHGGMTQFVVGDTLFHASVMIPLGDASGA